MSWSGSFDCDESHSADSEGRIASTGELLARINLDQGVTILLTTHDMADIERLCNRMLIIDPGRVIYDGGLEAIASNMYEVGHVQPAGIGLSARALAEGRAVWTPDLLGDPGLDRVVGEEGAGHGRGQAVFQ